MFESISEQKPESASLFASDFCWILGPESSVKSPQDHFFDDLPEIVSDQESACFFLFREFSFCEIFLCAYNFSSQYLVGDFI